jgi:DNA polymerase-3 subunit beta
MKLQADRATLMKALAHVQSVVERRNTIPILANVMIAVREGKLSLTATDMEIAIVEDVAASTTRNGACTAPAATLYEIVRRLPDGAEVELDHPGGDSQLTLRAGRYATSLVVLPVEDFPAMTAGALPHKFNLSAQTLRSLVDRTRKRGIISTESICTRPKARAPRCCARSPRTDIGSPGWRSRCPRAPRRCPVSSSHARP